MDMTLNIGHLLTVGSIIFFAGVFYATTRSQAAKAEADKLHAERMALLEKEQVKKDNDALKEDITDIKADLKTLNKVVMDVAAQNTRLDNQAERLSSIERRMDDRMGAMERRWEELRRGEGMVTEKARG